MTQGTVVAKHLASAIVVLVMVATMISLPALHVAAATVSPPGTIPSDCSMDVTDALQGWLDGIPDGSTIDFAAGSCYRVDGTFKVRERVGLTFVGNGATFRTVTDGTEAPNPRLRAHWRITNSDDISISNLVIDGPNTTGARNPKLEGQHGFDVGGGVRVTISGVTIREVFGDALDISASKGGRDDPLPERDSEDVTVENSDLQLLGRHGIGITSARRVTIRNNHVDEAKRSAIDIEPFTPAAVIEDILIQSNMFLDYDNFMVAGAGSCAESRNVTIIDNVANQGGMRIGRDGCPHRLNLTVERNTITLPSSGVGLSFLIVTRYAGVTVRDNDVAVGKPGPAVVLAGSLTPLTVTGNRFCGASAAVVGDEETDLVTESGNVLSC